MSRTNSSVSEIFKHQVLGGGGVSENTFKGWLNKGAKCAAIAAGGECPVS